MLKECIEALPGAFNDIPYEVILIDNASPPEEIGIYNTWRNPPFSFRIFLQKANLGFPKACNLGASKATAPLLFFLNSDVIMRAGSGELLVRDMDDPQIGVVGMKLLFPEKPILNPQIRPPGRVQHVGLVTNLMGDFYHIFLGWPADHPKVEAMREVSAVTGAALMTRKSLFQTLGGFWEGYGLGTWEDVDYCLTVAERGLKIVVNVNAVGIHHTGATVETYQIPYPIYENRLKFLLRHGNKLEYTEWKYL